MDKKFEYLEHTADKKFRAFGSTLEEAFKNSGLAMFNILVNPEDVKPEIKHKLKVNTRKLESLLYDFLEELLILLDTDGFVLSSIDKIEIKEKDGIFDLVCEFSGDSYKNYEVSGNIKSITYNDMKIEKVNNNYEITAVVDI
ncbi:archease [Nanoarchaeota archaeon]